MKKTKFYHVTFLLKNGLKYANSESQGQEYTKYTYIYCFNTNPDWKKKQFHTL